MSFVCTTTFTEGRHTGEYIKSEAKSMRSRDAVLIASGSGVAQPNGATLVQPGTVLGQQRIGAAAAAVAGGTNKGNGTLSAATLGPKANVGTYEVVFSGATAFQVVDPDGETLATGAAPGTWGANQAGYEIAFAFAAGSTAMQAGDSFTVAVAPGSEKYVPCVETATDGSQVAAAIAYAWSNTSAGDVAATITARDSEVFGLRLNWDPSIANNPTALAAAIAQLQARGIIIR